MKLDEDSIRPGLSSPYTFKGSVDQENPIPEDSGIVAVWFKGAVGQSCLLHRPQHEQEREAPLQPVFPIRDVHREMAFLVLLESVARVWGDAADVTGAGVQHVLVLDDEGEAGGADLHAQDVAALHGLFWRLRRTLLTF